MLDLGVLRGFGIYEGLAAFAGEPFHFSDHWERFKISADALGLVLPFSEKESLEMMRAVIEENSSGRRAHIRMVLTGGEAREGIKHVAGRETFFITAEPATMLPEVLYANGAPLLTHEHQRAFPAYKTTNYITAVLLQKKLEAAGAIEGLYVAGGMALECTTSNVFIVQNGSVITPKENILLGITRKVVLDIARKSHPTEERAVSIDELLGADEVFITSSFKDIIPVASVDAKAIGSGSPGPVTRDLMKSFAQHTDSH